MFVFIDLGAVMRKMKQNDFSGYLFEQILKRKHEHDDTKHEKEGNLYQGSDGFLTFQHSKNT